MASDIAAQLVAEINAQATEPTYTADGTRVYDGDTVRLPGAERNTRIAGVDTPETAKPGQEQQPGANIATQLVTEILNDGGTVQGAGGTDATGSRNVGTLVDAKGDDVATQLITQGLGTATKWSSQEQLDAETSNLVRRSGVNPALATPEGQAIDALVAADAEANPREFNLTAGRSGNSRYNAFTAGGARGGDMTQGLLYSAANAFGELTGVDAVAKWGEDGFKQQMIEASANPPQIEKFDDVESLADFGTYVAEALGEQLPNLALMATGAGAGAVAARAALGKAVLGRLGGTMATSYPLAVGEVQQELKDGGIDAPGTAFIAGLPIAALDAVGFEATIGRLFNGVSKPVREGIVGEVGRGLLKGAGIGVATEAPTEALQEVAVLAARAYEDPTFEIFTDENIARIKEAAIKGGIVGGVAGGAGGGIKSAITYEAPAANEDATDEATTSTPPTEEAPDANAVPPQDTPNTEPQAADPAGQPVDVADTLAAEAQSARDSGAAVPDQSPIDPTQYEVPSTEQQDTPRTVINEPNTDNEAPNNPAQEYQPDAVDEALRKEFEAQARPTLSTPSEPAQDAPYQTTDSAEPVTLEEREAVNGTPRIQSYDAARVSETEAASLGLQVESTNDEVVVADVQREKGEARSGTAKKVAAMFPGATAVDPKNAKKNWSVQVNRQDWKEEAAPQQVLDQVIKVFSDGVNTKNKRADVKMPDGSNGRINWMELIKLGALTAGYPSSTQSAMQRGRDNLLEGYAYLLEKGVKLPDLNPSTVVLVAGGKPITFGQLNKAGAALNAAAEALTQVERQLYKMAQAEKTNTRAFYKARGQRTKLRRELESFGIDPRNEVLEDALNEAGVNRETQRKDNPLGAPAEVVNHEDAVNAETARKQDPESYNKGNETESEQASKSSSLRQRGNKSKQKKPYLARYREMAASLLQELGFKDVRLDIMNERAAKERLADKNTPKQERTDIEEWLASGKAGRIVARPGEVPMIFISAKNGASEQAQLGVLLHEMGHLVQFTALDQAPKSVQKAIREASGTKSEDEFGEWFANQLGYWVSARKVPRGIVAKYFSGLVKQLRKWFNQLTKNEGLNTSYADFMDVMVGYRMSTLNKVRPKTDFGKLIKKEAGDVFVSPGKPNGNVKVADFAVREAVSSVITERRLKRLVDAKDHAVKWLMKARPLVETADGYMRSLKSAAVTKLADDWRHAVGTERTAKRPTISQEMRNYAGPKSQEMHAIIEKVSKLPEAEQKKLAGELIGQNENVSELGQEIREYFNGMYDLLNEKLGLKFKSRKNYFPLTLDMLKWSENREAIIKIIAKNYEGDVAAATRIYEEMRDQGGQFTVDEKGKVNLAGPSFGNMKARNMELKFIRELSDYFVRDIPSVMVAYTHSAIHRGVVQKRYGIERGAEKANGTYVPSDEYKYYSQLKKQYGITDVDLNSPLAKFAMNVRIAQAKGEITESEADRILNKILPAYLGRLGADISPTLRHLNSWGVVYQNIRLLGLSVFSSFVDIGTIMYRSGKPLKTLTTVLEGVLSKAKRKDMMDAARAMGEIRDDVADHVLNDQLTAEFMSPKAAKINDWFFRKIGMQGYTNFTRAVALSMGKQVLKGKPTKAQMKELGISYEELGAWREADSPTNFADNPGHQNVISALHQFVDESIIRPDATIRPVWGSDPRFMLLWHLKSFIYGFQKQILDRVIEQTKANPWPTKALPAVMLSMALLPFAAAGYEIRRFITGANGNSRELQGWEYLGELYQRSGATGLLQFVIDAEETSNRGRMGIVALGGPTVEQFITAMTKDAGYIFTHGVPGFAQSPAARAWFREQ
jgi:endonuclease YncB( thermonuclease family)/predicted HD phosphohydrolase